MSFTQQLQRHSRHHSGRSTQGAHMTADGAKGVSNAEIYGNKRHSNFLPNVQEYQSNIGELDRYYPWKEDS